MVLDIKCSACKQPIILAEGQFPEHIVFDRILCGYCYKMIRDNILCHINGLVYKILWGSGSIYRDNWLEIKKFLSDNEVKTIIEYGPGLSSELLIMDGYDVTSMEYKESFANICRKFNKNIITYNRKEGPHDLDRKFDFALVDSPENDRSKEANHAARHTERFIYMHNPAINQVEELEKFSWQPIESQSKTTGFFRFYRR